MKTGAARSRPTGASRLVAIWAERFRTPRDRVRWLLEFSVLVVERLSSRARTEYQWQATAFGRGHPVSGWRRELNQPITWEALAEQHRWLRSLLRELSRDESVDIELDHAPAYFLQRTRRGLHGAALTWERPWKDGFRLHTYESLLAEGQRLRFCERPLCRAAFLARRRQAYCTPRCSQAVRTQAYRTVHAERVRAARRAAYARKQRALLGSSNVRVGRVSRQNAAGIGNA